LAAPLISRAHSAKTRNPNRLAGDYLGTSFVGGQFGRLRNSLSKGRDRILSASRLRPIFSAAPTNASSGGAKKSAAAGRIKLGPPFIGGYRSIPIQWCLAKPRQRHSFPSMQPWQVSNVSPLLENCNFPARVQRHQALFSLGALCRFCGQLDHSARMTAEGRGASRSETVCLSELIGSNIRPLSAWRCES
jgi:hypothetical protein